MKIFINRCKVLISFDNHVDVNVMDYGVLGDIEVSWKNVKLSFLMEANRGFTQILPNTIDKMVIYPLEYMECSLSYNTGQEVILNSLELEDIVSKRNKDGVFIMQHIYKFKE